MKLLLFLKELYHHYQMYRNPNKYAKKIGVKIQNDTRLLGKVYFGTEPWLISIGSKTILSKNINFFNHDGAVSIIKNMNDRYLNCSKFGYIIIGDNCFIGANSTILMNVTIGSNSIVGANSLVTKDIPPGEVWGGNPAKFICKTYDYAEKVLSISGFIKKDELSEKEFSVLVADKFINKKSM